MILSQPRDSLSQPGTDSMASGQRLKLAQRVLRLPDEHVKAHLTANRP